MKKSDLFKSKIDAGEAVESVEKELIGSNYISNNGSNFLDIGSLVII